MKLFSFHLASPGLGKTLEFLLRPPLTGSTQGLSHIEIVVPMTLGRRVSQPSRYHPRQVAAFAAWEDESALEEFLSRDRCGMALARGWHVRMEFVRKWGQMKGFDGLPLTAMELDDEDPVVSFTLARLRVMEAVRFIRWGKPVERQVRDDPTTTIAMAAIRPLRTLATFSIWQTQRDLKQMVHGRRSDEASQKHAKAMQERNRKDFHHEFITMRFRPLSEHGIWEGRKQLLPTTPR
ncbi:MAG: hypothetical protein MUF13_07180 [Akkermansiaceae bacterium]|jgi:hypothetical protein|nr:hypothetical protein [Akkermansiaceae bacterium]